MIVDQPTVNVRYIVPDVQEALDFYTEHLGFTVLTTVLPAFADIQRGNLRLILSGPASSGGRPLPGGSTPTPGGLNRIHFVVDDLDADVARLEDAGAHFRSAIISGPGGRQAVFDDPAGNPIELFAPAGSR
ncbi:MAG TPA: VOC family protein [Microlunatus sp.]|nr:VOC family protein [Microlunatus sp.]